MDQNANVIGRALGTIWILVTGALLWENKLPAQ